MVQDTNKTESTPSALSDHSCEGERSGQNTESICISESIMDAFALWGCAPVPRKEIITVLGHLRKFLHNFRKIL